MSIWTDLLFLHGHVATPTGLAALAPDLRAPAAATPTAPHDDAPTTAPCAAEPATPKVTEPPSPRVTELAPAVRRMPRPNRISPNDLW